MTHIIISARGRVTNNNNSEELNMYSSPLFIKIPSSPPEDKWVHVDLAEGQVCKFIYPSRGVREQTVCHLLCHESLSIQTAWLVMNLSEVFGKLNQDPNVAT